MSRTIGASPWPSFPSSIPSFSSCLHGSRPSIFPFSQLKKRRETLPFSLSLFRILHRLACQSGQGHRKKEMGSERVSTFVFKLVLQWSSRARHVTEVAFHHLQSARSLLPLEQSVLQVTTSLARRVVFVHSHLSYIAGYNFQRSLTNVTTSS